MIDNEGFRANVGIILLNKYQEVFWAGRIGQPDAWQFPQGGVDKNESLEETLFRELYEEIGLSRDNVRLIGKTKDWLHYRLPKKYLRKKQVPICIGQKQIWFLLELVSSEEAISFNKSKTPEFDRWKWVDYWYPVSHVISFKRSVYRRALKEFEPIVFGIK